MSIEYPETRQEVIDRILSDIQNQLPELNPFLRASVIRSLGVAYGGRNFDVYTQIKQLEIELFPDTATQLDSIRRWGLYRNIDINPSAPAVGFITATGTASTIIPEGTIFVTENQTEYEVINQDYVITQQVLAIPPGGLTRSGSIAKVVLSADHNLATNTQVIIAGADQTEYNGTFTITVTDTNEFTYQITGSPLTPATGIITVTTTYASVEVESSDTGEDKNLDSGAQLSLQIPIVGVDTNAYVQYNKISGGTDLETTDEYRERVLEAYRNPPANFNDSNIISKAKSVPGVTRVWVFDATPTPGEIEVYFTRDNDADPIPDPTEVAQVKAEILKIKTAPMADVDVHVYPPTKHLVNFVFTDLVPDSLAMREAIEASLAQMFKEIPDVGEDLSEDAYRSVIFQTVNPNTGEFIKSFVLSAPVGNIPVTGGALAILGTITWAI